MVGLMGYIKDSDLFKSEKPYQYEGPACGLKPRNFENPLVEIQLTDMRTVPDFKPTLASHGFTFLEHKSKELPTLTDETNSQAYADEMVELLKEHSGAKVIWPFNTRLRSAAKEHFKVAPTSDIHTDVAYGDGWPRISRHLTKQEQEDALSGKLRVRIMNIWRPMVNHAEDYPLAVLDPHSIQDINDVVNVDVIAPPDVSGVAYYRYDPRHRWYWMSNMTPDELIMFTQYDTHPPDGKYNLIGHAAFRNMDARPGCPKRQSVEARYILLEPAPYPKEKPFGELKQYESRKQPWRDYVKIPEAGPIPPFPEGKSRQLLFGPNNNKATAPAAVAAN